MHLKTLKPFFLSLIFLPTLAFCQVLLSSSIEINDTTLNGPSLANSDSYGSSVAYLGDLDNDGVGDIAVGARYDDEGGSNRGAVHISFLNANGSVKNTVEINSSTFGGLNLSNVDSFGVSIASLGDLDHDGIVDIAVGANFDDEGGSNRGAVHILFLNSNGTVKSTREINSSTSNGPILANSDYYGTSVASLGDLDGDGVVDIAVGAAGDKGGGTSRGAVHISFLRTDGTVKSTVKMNGSTTNGPSLANGDSYGISVSALGDLDGDGIPDVAVGANGDAGSGSSIGAVHISFLKADATIKSTVEINDKTINGPSLLDGDQFGTAVSSLGDLDGDGIVDVGIGAIRDDGNGADRGAVHICFLNVNGSVKSSLEINDATNNGPSIANLDLYGTSITTVGDFNGDSVVDILVGAAADSGAGSGRGAVHISLLTFVHNNPDTDGDGNPDATDLDDDNDGVTDIKESADGSSKLDPGSFITKIETSTCAAWNGFLGLFNILEHVNLTESQLIFNSSLFNVAGVVQSSTGFGVGAGAQLDLLVHDMPGFQVNAIGQVCSTANVASTGDFDGRMVLYRPAIKSSKRWDFAFALPFDNGVIGKQFVLFNTYQPSLDPADASNFVANWVRLSNVSSGTESGTLYYYAQDGTVLATTRLSLVAGAAADFAGHQFGNNLVGMIEWRPDSASAKSRMRNIRYFYDNSTLVNSFDSAFQLSGTKGSGEKLIVPLDTREGSAILEIANTLSTATTVNVQIYDQEGSLQPPPLNFTLAPYASIHLITDAILKGKAGIAKIRGNQVSSVLAVAMQYGRTGTAGISYLYGIQAVQALGAKLQSSYNTYLSQGCRGLIANSTSSPQNVTISMKRSDGTNVLAGDVQVVPANGLLDYDVCANEGPSNYGVVTFTPENTGTLGGTVLRLGQADEYRFPTPAR